MKPLSTLIAIAAFAGLPLSQAHASSASVHLSQLTFTAIDLLPDDGLAPSFEFLANDHLFTKIRSHGPHEFVQERSAPGLLADLSYSPGSSISQSNVVVGHDKVDLTSSVSSSGPYFVAVSAFSHSDTFFSPTFRVGAGTRLLISAMLDLSATASCGPQALTCQSNAGVTMSAGDRVVNKYVSAGAATLPPTYSGVFELAYDNLGHVAKTIEFSIIASTDLVSLSQSAVVPEPSGYGLLMTGLLAAGVVKRRKSQRSVV